MPSRRAPLAENDKFAIWRLQGGGASDVVLDKETGRWAIGALAARRLDSPGDTDEERQASIAGLVRELELELTDGSSAAPLEGPSLGM